jgi:hypothetical protein
MPRPANGFALEIGEGERALDVFHHPFAYAAARDTETRLSPANSGSSARRPAA